MLHLTVRGEENGLEENDSQVSDVGFWVVWWTNLRFSFLIYKMGKDITDISIWEVSQIIVYGNLSTSTWLELKKYSFFLLSPIVSVSNVL